LCIGIFLILTTVVIAKDGVIFIDYAKELGMSPYQTMIDGYQHPGYPFLILATSKIIGLFYKSNQLFQFIYSAQIAALLFRVLSIIVLYFIGKEIVGSKYSFRAILILIVLPKPAEYGSDALSDWPHLFFISAGMLLLLYGAKYGKWWIFAFAGMAGGLAYLIRPEGAQVVVYGSWWLLLQLLWKKRTIGQPKALLGLVSMVFIFIIIVFPYMKLKGAIFPKKDIGDFSLQTQPVESNSTQVLPSISCNAAVIPADVMKAIGLIFENIGDTLMWFFLVPYLTGIFQYFKKQKLLEPNQFFIISLVFLNILLMIWLYYSQGYMSGRHTLPLVVFTIYFVPTGLNRLASWLNVKFSKGYEHTHRWFAILISIGIAVCIPKLFSSLHTDKYIYRQAAQWLAQNTDSSAIIGVPDYRINFYAEREGIKILDENLPQVISYLAEIVDIKDKQEQTKKQGFQKVFSTGSGSGKKEVVIYKKVTQ
jgi:hypothetical protein